MDRRAAKELMHAKEAAAARQAQLGKESVGEFTGTIEGPNRLRSAGPHPSPPR